MWSNENFNFKTKLNQIEYWESMLIYKIINKEIGKYKKNLK